MRGIDTTDWTVFGNEGVYEVAENAAKAVANHEQYREFVEYEDLLQDALIFVASMPDDVRECLDPESGLTLGVLKYRVEMDLIDGIKYDAKQRQRHQSFEQRYTDEEAGDYTPRLVSVDLRQEIGGYTRELVESLIPAIWDEDYCYGIRVENAPDADMPRGSTNKATGNTLGAHIADIKRAWEKTDLTAEEKQAILLCHGLDWTQRDAGYKLGVSQQAVSHRLYTGIGKMVAFLNGGVFYEMTGEELEAA